MKKIDYEKLQVNQRQLELYSKHYRLDEENKTIGVTLHYEKVSDILNYSIGNNNAPLYSQDVIETVLQRLENAPVNYKVELDFEVEDFEGVDPKYLIESFNDSLEMGQYKSRRDTLKREVMAASLVLAGIFVLFFQIIGKSNGWFGSDIQESIFTEVIDITAWVFIWEAVTLLFLEHSDSTKFAILIKKKVTKITIFKKGEKDCLASENFEQVYTKWVKEEGFKKVGKYFMLISSFAFIFLAFWGIYLLTKTLQNPEISNAGKISTTIVTIIDSLITFFAGLGGIYKYLGKYNKISKFVGPFAIALLIVIVLNLISDITLGQIGSIVSSSMSLILSIFYIIGYFVDKYYQQNN